MNEVLSDISERFDLPPRLARRPRDRRGLPVPFVQASHPDGSPDFTAVDARLVMDAIGRHLCGLCGQRLDYWIAFVGGPTSVAQQMFLDPPMHVDCARAALQLCPHMAHQVSRRASKTDAVAPEGFVAGKPDAWFLYVTRTFKVRRTSEAYVLVAAPAKQLERFDYVDGVLQPSDR